MLESGSVKKMTITPDRFYTNMGVEWLAERKSQENTENELSYLMNLIGNRSRILDLACGYGRFSIPLALEGYEVHGIDITPSFIDEARKNALNHNLSIDFRVGDMRKISYGDGMFQHVICMWNAFSEIVFPEDQKRSIKEIYRVLEKKGSAILEIRNHRSSWPVMENSIDGVQAFPTFNHTRGSMKKLLEFSGIMNYHVFIDKFGGRNRLLIIFTKN